MIRYLLLEQLPVGVLLQCSGLPVTGSESVLRQYASQLSPLAALLLKSNMGRAVRDDDEV